MRFNSTECPVNSNRLVPFRRRSTYPRLSCVVFARVLSHPSFDLFRAQLAQWAPREGAAVMWRAHPITPAIIVPLSFDPWRYADTSLPIDPMPLLAFAIASFSRPRPVVKGLVDLRATVHYLPSRSTLLKSETGFGTVRIDGRANEQMLRAKGVLHLDWIIGLGPSTAATAIIDSHLHIARGPFFWPCKGGPGGGVCVGVELRLRPESLGPKAMNCTFWLLLPARCVPLRFLFQ